jgi:hypothetical protein
MAEIKKIIGFKKFSDIKGGSKIEEVELNGKPDTDSDRPALPNMPNNSKKVEKPVSTKEIKPVYHDVDFSSDEDRFDSEESNEKVVTTYGKVAKFPKNVKASKAYNFMENVKISKKSIWYLMVEKMDINGESLQLVKYNYNEGVDLNKFVNDLKGYYLNKYKDNKSLCESINKIEADGNDKYSIIKGITPIEIGGKKLITIITEDLIKLLSK